MKLTQKLLGYLNRVFEKDPQAFVAFNFSYAGTDMAWVVDDGFLTVTVTGGVGANFTVDLSQYTLFGLASFVAGRAGFTVTYIPAPPVSGLSALVLLDSSGQQSAGKTKISAYSSILYAYLETYAQVLETAESDLVEALKQTSIADDAGDASAAGIWLDEIGGYYGIRRVAGEADGSYGPRIVAEVIQPKSNNVAMEAAIKYYTGQATSVVDATLPAFTSPLHNGAITHNSSNTHNSTGSLQYNLFDVTVGYDLINGAAPDTFKAQVTAVVDRIRAAGTHMRALALSGSIIGETFTPPTDAMATLMVMIALADTLTAPTESFAITSGGVAGYSDTLTVPTEGDGLDVTYSTLHNGLRSHNGAVIYASGHTTHGDLPGAISSVT